ncbi:MAG: class I SAM-dependent methyltransferase [Bryobacteraceae bacterium]
MPEPSPAREGRYDPRHNQALFAVEDRHFWFRGRNRIVAAMAAKYTGQLAAGFYVLEVGRGNGSVTRVLQDTCETGNVIGADLYFEGLVNARSRGVKALVQADMSRFPFGSGFALAGMFDVLEHVPDDCGALRCIYNALSPGGRLLLSVPAHQSLWSYFDEAACHGRRYELEGLRSRCLDAGFEVEYATEFISFLYPLLKTHGGGKTLCGKERVRKSRKPSMTLLNTVLDLVGRSETFLIRRAVRLPFGTSIFLVARKPLVPDQC